METDVIVQAGLRFELDRLADSVRRKCPELSFPDPYRALAADRLEDGRTQQRPLVARHGSEHFASIASPTNQIPEPLPPRQTELPAFIDASNEGCQASFERVLKHVAENTLGSPQSPVDVYRLYQPIKCGRPV